MVNNIFKSGLDTILGVAKTTGSEIHNVIQKGFDTAFSKKPENSTKPVETSTPNKNEIDSNRMMDAIKNNETRGEKNPYSYYRNSGSKIQGRALGAYQVTDGELKTYGKKFLGKDVTGDQFLADPKIQDTYMTAKIKHGEKDLGLSPEEILATHRGGYTNPDKAMVKYNKYVTDGMAQYSNNKITLK